MFEIIRASRKSAVLVPSGLACLSSLPTINLTAGCAHGCLYCYTRGYSSYPGEGKIKIYENTLEKLKRELPRKKVRPHAVYFSPSSDAFQPVPEVQELSCRVFEFLLREDVRIAFLTKGEIPSQHMKLFKSHPDKVRVQVGLITMDDSLLKIFEPRAACLETRLKQIKELTKAGIRTQVRLDPILPGITDDRKNLNELFHAISRLGVKTAAAATLFLRPIISGSLRRHLKNSKLTESILSRYNKGNLTSMLGETSKIIALPKEEREKILGRVVDIGREHGVAVKICACKNPDLASESCSIAGDWIKPPPEAEQLGLFDNPERS